VEVIQESSSSSKVKPGHATQALFAVTGPVHCLTHEEWVLKNLHSIHLLFEIIYVFEIDYLSFICEQLFIEFVQA